MRRREALAGVASLGVLGGGGVLAVGGVPSLNGGDEEPAHDPIEVRTVEAPGSEAGTVSVPEAGTIYVLDFFATTCSICQSLMPTLAEANDELPDDVSLLSVTIETDDGAIRDFWTEHGGDWTVGTDSDPIELYPAHEIVGTPTMIVMDGDGVVHWRRKGRKSVADILGAVEDARAAYSS